MENVWTECEFGLGLKMSSHRNVSFMNLDITLLNITAASLS